MGERAQVHTFHPVQLQDGRALFTGRTDAEAEAPVLRPPVAKSQLTGKETPDAGKRLKTKGKEGGRGQDGWMASLTQRT